MIKIDRSNMRQVMKELRNGNSIYLNGKMLSRKDNNTFIVEYTYNGVTNKVERSGVWIRNFIKKDYLNEDLYLAEIKWVFQITGGDQNDKCMDWGFARWSTNRKYK